MIFIAIAIVFLALLSWSSCSTVRLTPQEPSPVSAEKCSISQQNGARGDLDKNFSGPGEHWTGSGLDGCTTWVITGKQALKVCFRVEIPISNGKFDAVFQPENPSCRVDNYNVGAY